MQFVKSKISRISKKSLILFSHKKGQIYFLQAIFAVPTVIYVPRIKVNDLCILNNIIKDSIIGKSVS